MRYPVDESSANYIPAGRQTRWRSTRIERTAKELVLTVQDYSLFAYRAFMNLFRPPIYWSEFLMQADIIGVGSLVHRGALRPLHRRRAGAAIGGHALGLRRHRHHRPICLAHHDPRTGPGADRRHGQRPQRLLDGQRTRLDGGDRADRRHARAGRRSDAQAGHAAHLLPPSSCSFSSPSSPTPAASPAAAWSPSS